MSRKVAILGAGFSGLTLAWELTKLGFQIEIFESKDRPGGIIQTEKKPVLVESAAHAFLASADVENLFQELQVPLATAGFRAKSKWIFRSGRAQKWTLSPWSTLKALAPLILSRMTGRHWPRSQETVAAWLKRLSSEELSDFLASPALQGVYGTQVENLSASLILGGVFSKEIRPGRGRYKGSLAPLQGMQELLIALTQKLREKNVRIHYERSESLEYLKTQFDSVIVATSIQSASELLKSVAPNISEALFKIPKVSLSSVTVAYQKQSARIRGFGCLFPKKENFQSLGVLFNTDLFENRGPLETETWIFQNHFLMVSDSEVIEKIKMDRQRLAAEDMDFEFHRIHRWSQVLPLYGQELESLLESQHFNVRSEPMKIPALKVVRDGAKLQESEYPLYLTGNYLGAIGLTKILTYNRRLAQRIHKELRGGN